MKFVRHLHRGAPRLLVADGDDWHEVASATDLGDLLVLGEHGMREAAARAIASAPAVEVPTSGLLSPIGTPPTIRDFYAFEDHVRAGRAWRGLEMDPVWYQRPVFYFSNPYAVVGPGEVRMTPGSTQFDFELEIAAILWGGGSDLSSSDAEGLIAGFCIMSDWSGRDVQQDEMRLSLGPAKGKDTATTLGPVFVTVDELADRRRGSGYDLEMSTRVNGATYSRSNLGSMYWSFGELIAYASRGTEVRAGDVIGSGTTDRGCLVELRAGTGERFPWLKPGDVVEFEVERLGTSTSTVVAGPEVVPLRP